MEDHRFVTGELSGGDPLHLVVVGATGVDAKVPFNLERLAFIGDEEEKSLSSLFNILSGFIEVVVGNDEVSITVEGNWEDIDAVGNALFTDGGEDNGSLSSLPSFP